jgi:hypothetical protein
MIESTGMFQQPIRLQLLKLLLNLKSENILYRVPPFHSQNVLSQLCSQLSIIDCLAIFVARERRVSPQAISRSVDLLSD